MTDLFGRLAGPREDGSETESVQELETNARGARWLRRTLAGGVVALTTSVGGAYRGTTLTGCIVASTDPIQFLVSVESQSQIAEWLAQSKVFGLSILCWRQQFLADQFAGFTPVASAEFRGIQHFTATTGSPLLTEAIAWADCEVVSVAETGDHTIFIGNALDIGRGEGTQGDPLLYFMNRYRRLK